MTLYERTNNPLNIRFNKANNWRGQTTVHHGFVVFKTPEYGYRAAYVLLCNYIRKGYNTPRKIITRWAPPAENDTQAYIDYVSTVADISPDTKIGIETQSDYWTILILMAAMARIENNLHVQPQDINLALGIVL